MQKCPATWLSCCRHRCRQPRPRRTHLPAPPRRGLLLQDISSGNLLLKKNVGDGCVLLFSDPSRAELMDNLDSPDAYAAFPHVNAVAAAPSADAASTCIVGTRLPLVTALRGPVTILAGHQLAQPP